MIFLILSKRFSFLWIGLFLISMPCHAELSQTIRQIKPAVVGIGTYQKIRNPPVSFMGTGFVVADGLHIVTNAHVIPAILDTEKMESYVVITGESEKPEFRSAEIVALDKEHDLALLKISGTALPTMKFGPVEMVLEGKRMAYTGFPIGMILGFYPVTHQAIISSITPVILPAHSSRQLDASMVKQLRRTPYKVFQLDGVAYPGNSGSPLYDPDTGLVYGVVNMVFVKEKKESALSNPSGITYAIPGNYIQNLLDKYIGNTEH
ncbi:MAG: serine protease [Pseudomonadota bacterium]